MTLSLWLGATGIIILWHIRSPLRILMFMSVAFLHRPLGIGILLTPLLKVPMMELLSSLLWWELGTNLPGPGEWLSFWSVTSKQFWFWPVYHHSYTLVYRLILWFKSTSNIKYLSELLLQTLLWTDDSAVDNHVTSEQWPKPKIASLAKLP